MALFFNSILFIFSSYFMSSASDSRLSLMVSLDSSKSSSCVYVLTILGTLGGFSFAFSSFAFLRATTASVIFLVLARSEGRSELR